MRNGHQKYDFTKVLHGVIYDSLRKITIGEIHRVGHIGFGKIKNSKYPIFRVLFLLGVSWLEVISKSVLKGVILIEKRECRGNLFSFHGDQLTLLVSVYCFNVIHRHNLKKFRLFLETKIKKTDSDFLLI